ncbi:MAG: hypothetical protein WCT32_02020 [Patescibacteria group bacterium]|jgi:hypothetical protein
MSKIAIVLIVLFSFAAGFGGGWVYDLTLGKETATVSTTTDTATTTGTTAAKAQTLEECLTEVWGADKYAAISANSNLATTDDNLAALRCYK